MMKHLPVNIHYKSPFPSIKNIDAQGDLELDQGLRSYLKDFLAHNGRSVFLKLHQDSSLWQESLLMAQKFSDKTHFVHLGIGGSSLGPKMMIQTLSPLSMQKNFTFLENVDETYLQEQIQELKSIGLQNCVFFVVSKSGHTVETLSLFLAILNVLREENISEEQWKDYFVVATDPTENDLRRFAQKYQLEQFSIPKLLGGRFSTLSSVGLFPCAFAKIPLSNLRLACEEFYQNLLSEENSPLFRVLKDIYYHYEKEKITQTVLMPYSSKLSYFTQWFVQLWAESLGKKHPGNKSSVGLTPIASVGATDQHSQMQLFMEGPRDKFILFIEIEKIRQTGLSLENNYPFPHLKKLSGVGLHQLLRAELQGELMALKEYDRPWGCLGLESLGEKSFVHLVLFFETLTVLMGHLLGIDPFDQPGVELGKIMAQKTLELQQETNREIVV